MFRFAFFASIVTLSATSAPLLKLDADLAATLNKLRPMENARLFEGDILNAKRNLTYNALTNKYGLWPRGQIPYVIDPSLQGLTSLIQNAMEQYHRNTCIRFVPFDGTQRNYVRIFNGQGCYANVGMVGGEQPLSLGQGCHFMGTTVHELGHVVGFYHEHTRSDRDDFIDLFLDPDTVDSQYLPQFEKLQHSENNLYNAFDYNSVMLYGSKSFSKNGRSTMLSKRGETLAEVHEKSGLTQSDIERVQKLYDCGSSSAVEQNQISPMVETGLPPLWIWTGWNADGNNNQSKITQTTS